MKNVVISDRASNTRLIQLATVKSRLGISDSSQDDLLGELIDSACSLITSYLGRPLAYQGYTETTTGCSQYHEHLSRFPVDSTTLVVTSDGLDISDSVEVVSTETGLLYDEDAFMSEPWGLEFDYWAGYLLPGDVADWAAGTAYSAGDFVRPVSYAGYVYLMECTTAGTSNGVSEPVWTALDAGDTVTDGTVVWTVREVQELPTDLQLAAWFAVSHLYQTLNERSGLTSRRVDGFSESYEPSGANAAIGRPAQIVGLPTHVRALLDLWRVSPL